MIYSYTVNPNSNAKKCLFFICNFFPQQLEVCLPFKLMPKNIQIVVLELLIPSTARKSTLIRRVLICLQFLGKEITYTGNEQILSMHSSTAFDKWRCAHGTHTSFNNGTFIMCSQRIKSSFFSVSPPTTWGNQCSCILLKSLKTLASPVLSPVFILCSSSPGSHATLVLDWEVLISALP